MLLWSSMCLTLWLWCILTDLSSCLRFWVDQTVNQSELESMIVVTGVPANAGLPLMVLSAIMH